MTVRLHTGGKPLVLFLLLLGLAGLLGNLLQIHLLMSFGVTGSQEISLFSAIGIVWVAVTLYLFLLQPERQKMSSFQRILGGLCVTFLLLTGISCFWLYMLAFHFSPLQALVYSYSYNIFNISFIGTLKFILFGLCLFCLLFLPRRALLIYGVGTVAFLMLGLDIYALIGHLLGVGFLFNYELSFPGTLASILVSLTLLQLTATSEGLLSPFASSLTQVRAMAAIGLLVIAGFMVESSLVITGLQAYVQPSVNHELTSLDIILVLLQYGTILMSSVLGILMMRALHYYDRSNLSELALRKLNTELEQRVAERTAELESVVSQLEEVNRSQKAFAYLVSYDLHAPLRIISSLIEILMATATEKLNPDEKKLLARIDDRCRQMRYLVDDLLEFCSVAYYRFQLEEVDLSNLAKAIILEFRELEPSRRVEVQVEPGLTLKGDPRLLNIILKNLLHNAWKYTSQNPNARIEFGKTVIQGKTTFFVKDNGVGFSMEAAHRLFRPFERLHTRTNFKGAGLGLATVARILERYHGAVWGVGKVGEGAIFYFQLPDASELPGCAPGEKLGSDAWVCKSGLPGKAARLKASGEGAPKN